MTSLSLSFAPIIPLWLLWPCAIVAILLTALGFAMRARGAIFRLAAMAIFLFALAGPYLAHEKRDPLSDVVVLVADRSSSQAAPSRTLATDQALAALKEHLAVPGVDVRTVEARPSANDDGTYLFAPLSDALKDVPASRIGGVIFLTDGQVHDAPSSFKSLGFNAPVHALITGEKGEQDRKLTVLQSPRFGIVGQKLSFTVRADDLGAPAQGRGALLSMRTNAGAPKTVPIVTGQPQKIEFEIAHGGENVIELEVEAGPKELTLENNRAVLAINGVRDRLRVLLVSGEPHAGERTWRNLLKADPSVDLVHFTILRPPTKTDLTDERELALIGFPVDELFSTKLYDFDLIIFDRYRQQVIPPAYFGFMADYVENGGALLIASGPDFNGPDSIAQTALASLLPAQPGTRVIEQGFRPTVSELGFRHPVTAGLTGANAPNNASAPSWGRWFRLVDTVQRGGEALMTGPDNRPLLVLDTAGKGRVAQLLSDQAWLWARGFEGGGPQAELLRRLAHWLMKEPDLEEEVLSGEVRGHTLQIKRRTMADKSEPVNIEFPDGKRQIVGLKSDGPGHFTVSLEISQMGIYRLTDGKLSAIVAVGPLNPKEIADMRATQDILAPIAKPSGGGLFWIGSDKGARNLPAVHFVGNGRTSSGPGWLGIKRNGAYAVSAVTQKPLMPPAIALALIFGFLLLAWRREST